MSDKILNPKTGRLVLRRGRIGRKIVKNLGLKKKYMTTSDFDVIDKNYKKLFNEYKNKING